MKKIYCLLLILFILFELTLSWFQYYNMTLDGDLPALALGKEPVSFVLEDPLGIKVILEGKSYPGTNRYFAHQALYSYYEIMPKFIQNFTSPLNSLYLSGAVFKIFLHVNLLFVLSLYIIGKIDFMSVAGLRVTALLSCFFQTYGYYESIGIIDNSITYTFFYAFPMLLFLALLLPYVLYFRFGKAKFVASWTWNVLSSLGMLCLCLSGPLIAGVVLILITCFILITLFKRYRTEQNLFNIIPMTIKYFMISGFFFAIYSLYIGSFNSENSDVHISILSRFTLLPIGLWRILSLKLAWFIIISLIVLCYILMFRNFKLESQSIRISLHCILLFCLLYIVALPLGGYRFYRPLIIRSDTFLPVTILSIVGLVISINFLLKKLHGKFLYLLYALVFSTMTIFTYADLEVKTLGRVEKKCIQLLIDSKDDVIKLPSHINVLSWGLCKRPEETIHRVEFLMKCNVLKRKVLYYQE